MLILLTFINLGIVFNLEMKVDGLLEVCHRIEKSLTGVIEVPNLIIECISNDIMAEKFDKRMLRMEYFSDMVYHNLHCLRKYIYILLFM